MLDDKSRQVDVAIQTRTIARILIRVGELLPFLYGTRDGLTVAITSPMAPTALPSQQTPAKGRHCANGKSANLPPRLPPRSFGLHHIPLVSWHSVLLPCPVA